LLDSESLTRIRECLSDSAVVVELQVTSMLDITRSL
jgi:hypothetical protein